MLPDWVLLLSVQALRVSVGVREAESVGCALAVPDEDCVRVGV